MKAKDFFSEEQIQQIVESISRAEEKTSGELRVHLTDKCQSGDPKSEAIKIFEKLKMHQTEQRNGVLFYLAYKDKRFAIIGDKGINELVPVNFWDNIRDNMQNHFRNGQFVQGLTEGIEEAGNSLKKYFPIKSRDTNELSNDISFEHD
ncbi:MAG: TPM domain-containing protein [Flavobacteriia bacterium]|nr:TPM domain-containing protein [Flavobacteriia bacterium]